MSMIMNKVEFWLMNNPVRSIIQRFETKRMRDMTTYTGGNVLEIGCGQGVGTRLINKYFQPVNITAIDLDPKMIQCAKKKVTDANVTFQKGDVSKLTFKNSSFDAVFDYGILHHVKNWKEALNELHRVLKPGGEIIMEDLSVESFRIPIMGWLMRIFLDHPYDYMYRRDDFIQEAKKLGFTIQNKKSNIFWFNLILKKAE